MAFYKIKNGKPMIANKSHGEDWNEYEIGSEPQELIDAEQFSINEEIDIKTVNYNDKKYLKGNMSKLVAIYAILSNPTDEFLIKTHEGEEVLLNKNDIKEILILILNNDE